jgi:multisubunit Na+/H+ antiporter MnhB subunit
MNATEMTKLVARLLLLPILLIGIALLIKGYGHPGGGFSGGLVAALGIILQYAVFGHEEAEQQLPFTAGSAPMLTVAGLLMMLIVSFAPLVVGNAPLSHWPAPGAEVIRLGTLELHTALVFETGVFLVVLGFVVTALHTLAHGKTS